MDKFKKFNKIRTNWLEYLSDYSDAVKHHAPESDIFERQNKINSSNIQFLTLEIYKLFKKSTPLSKQNIEKQ